MRRCHSRVTLLPVKSGKACNEHIIWHTVEHIPGSQNVLDNDKSRHFHSWNTEWKLIFLVRICKALKLFSINFQVTIDFSAF
jgi:hypothetical protein